LEYGFGHLSSDLSWQSWDTEMKAQCDKHGCKELLCGCQVQDLESNQDFSEIIRAKDKWINKLLTQIDSSGLTGIDTDHPEVKK